MISRRGFLLGTAATLAAPSTLASVAPLEALDGFVMVGDNAFADYQAAMLREIARVMSLPFSSYAEAVTSAVDGLTALPVPVPPPYQRWRYPPLCPDADYCRANAQCFWDCEADPDAGID